MIQKISRVFVVFCLLLWLMPLGFFIKPSQEKLACGGQRAICMCSIKAKLEKVNHGQYKIVLSSQGSEHDHQERNASGSSQYVAFYKDFSLPVSFDLTLAFDQIKIHSLLLIDQIDHIPLV